MDETGQGSRSDLSGREGRGDVKRDKRLERNKRVSRWCISDSTLSGRCMYVYGFEHVTCWMYRYVSCGREIATERKHVRREMDYTEGKRRNRVEILGEGDGGLVQ